ncbi:MAG: DNA polymerase [Candidatus Gracilibacteria bacterium]|nr:DNA polymerase [Candidatus Gracilibacteria bacterium]
MMAKFFDIKLRDYVYSPNHKNAGFGYYGDKKHDYVVSEYPQEMSAEKSYFSFLDSSEIGNDENSGKGLEYIFDLESELLQVLARMEYEGVTIDSTKLKELGEYLEKESKRIEVEIYELTGESFNINSAKQVQEMLFGKLKIPTNKKIKTGFSVDNEVLSYIAKDHAIAGLILEYRGLKKLQSTYVEGLLKSINPRTKKIHTTYNQTQASTGRLSSETPNLQNIPSGDKNSDEIKSCFIPSKPGYTLLVADYSQVEIRILANLSEDVTLIDAFKNNEDIHMRTAKLLFGEDTMISSELRRRAKTVNFGVIYGISGFGLSKTMDISPKEASEYIEKFYDKYSGVKTYYERILEEARKTGYVETFFGRRRYISGLNDANKIIKGQAEREAINMPIQGTAADVIKIAMINIANFLKDGNYRSKMILQVHDELVFEIHDDEMMILKEKIKEIMENTFPFEIKLFVEIGTGKNWKEAK